MLTGTLLAVVAFVAWGVSDFAAGFAAKHLSALRILWYSQWVGLAFAVVVLFCAGRALHVTGPVLGWSAIAAVVETVGFLAFYRAFARGVISVVAPISAMGVLVPVAIDVAEGRLPSWPVLCGIAAAVVGAALLAGLRRPSSGTSILSPEALTLAVIAALSFGFYLVFTAKAAAHDELVTGVLMKCVSLPLIAILLAVQTFRAAPPLVTLQARKPCMTHLAAVLVVVGAADGIGNVAYALAANRTHLAVVAAIASLYPAVTVLLARFILIERLDRRQQGGAGLALLGIALMSS